MSKPYQSVEQSLRDALVGLRDLTKADLHDGSNGSCPICLAVRAADEAIALKPSESREEWRVVWGVLRGPDASDDRYWVDVESVSHPSVESATEFLCGLAVTLDKARTRKVRIESCIAASPWVEVPAGSPIQPLHQTLCRFAGDSGRPCQTCGKSWHSPDHQAPVFDPKVAR